MTLNNEAADLTRAAELIAQGDALLAEMAGDGVHTEHVRRVSVESLGWKYCPGWLLFLVTTATESYVVSADAIDNVQTNLYLRSNGAVDASRRSATITYLQRNPYSLAWDAGRDGFSESNEEPSWWHIGAPDPHA